MGKIRISRQEPEDRLSPGELKPAGRIKNGRRKNIPRPINNPKSFFSRPYLMNEENLSWRSELSVCPTWVNRVYLMP